MGGPTIYKVRNKFYHSVLIQFTNINKCNNQAEQYIFTPPFYTQTGINNSITLCM